MPIPVQRETAVRRLLESGSGLSYREIARQTGVSRSTVGAIANGSREAKLARKAAEARTTDLPRPAGPFVQCSGCDARVQLPCLACGLRRLLKEARRPPSIGGQDDPSEPLVIELMGEDLERYLALRRRKELQLSTLNPQPSTLDDEPTDEQLAVAADLLEAGFDLLDPDP